VLRRIPPPKEKKSVLTEDYILIKNSVAKFKATVAHKNVVTMKRINPGTNT
jgi:hypothetical protein